MPPLPPTRLGLRNRAALVGLFAILVTMAWLVFRAHERGPSLFEWCERYHLATFEGDKRAILKAIHARGEPAVRTLVAWCISGLPDARSTWYRTKWENLPPIVRSALPVPREVRMNLAGPTLDALRPPLCILRPLVESRLGQTNWVAQIEAAYILSLAGDGVEQAVPLFVHWLGSNDASLAHTAARSLERCGPAAAPAVPALIVALTNPPVAFWAARALGRIGPAAAMATNALTSLLARAPPNSNQASAWNFPAKIALYRITRDTNLVTALLEEIERGTSQSWLFAGLQHLGTLAQPLVPRLRTLCREGDNETSIRAWQVLQATGVERQELIDLALEQARGGDSARRAGALQSLCGMDPPPEEAIAEVIASVTDSRIERGWVTFYINLLGSMRGHARAALPALESLRADGYFQDAADQAIRRIRSEVVE